MELIVKPDCGNSPKKQMLKEFNQAFFIPDAEKILSFVAEDIVWEMVGQFVVHGKEEMRKELDKMVADGNPDFKEVIVENIITHGKSGAMNGRMIGEDFEYVFADVYEFDKAGPNGKINKLTAFVIEL